MRIEYDPKHDLLNIEFLGDGAIAESLELDGVVIDYSKDRRKIIFELGREHEIRAAYLFGSYARGSAKEYSDIDVAIIVGRFRNGGPFDERFDIFHQVQQRNSLIEVVCFTEEEFDHGAAPVVRFIKNEGIRIL